jgi:hypothetical protein
MESFCAQCGPNVKLDEDGCCIGCGGSAMGDGVDTLSTKLMEIIDGLSYVDEKGDPCAIATTTIREIQDAMGIK